MNFLFPTHYIPTLTPLIHVPFQIRRQSIELDNLDRYPSKRALSVGSQDAHCPQVLYLTMTLHHSELVSPCSFLSDPRGPVHPLPGVRPGGGQVHRGPQDPCLHSRRAGGGGAAEDRQGATREGLLAFFLQIPSSLSHLCFLRTSRKNVCQPRQIGRNTV